MKETDSTRISGSDNGMTRLTIMGSTGSIGTQTLEIARAYPERFRVTALTACTNWELLARQALEFHPRMVVIADATYFSRLEEELKHTGIEVMAGEQYLDVAATLPETDIVVGALVGYSGLASTIAALKADKTVALANKETLVVAGEIINSLVKEHGKRILPVDSEHSAIFQCLLGEDEADVSSLILTASGGPFLHLDRNALENVTLEQALAHPNWNMGPKVTIDSATMMNKGFEMMEARWLFNRRPDEIRILVHPESIVHSMVEFTDGSVKAQLGIPDMRIPIAVALAYPGRLDLTERAGLRHLNLAETGKLTFMKPDFDRFPLLRLAYEAAEKGGLVPAILNAANEVAVKAFLNREIRFCGIGEIVEKTVMKFTTEAAKESVTLLNIANAHNEGTKFAQSLIAGESTLRP